MQFNSPANAPVPDSAGGGAVPKALGRRHPAPVSRTHPVFVLGEAVSREDDLGRRNKPAGPGQWWPWLLASAALHGLVLAMLFVCGMLTGPMSEPPLMIIGSINLAGLGGGEPSGGDGLEGGSVGAARAAVDAASAEAAAPAQATVARTETAATPAQTTEQSPDPTPEQTPQPVPESLAMPAPALAPQTPRPKPQASPKPRHKTLDAKAQPAGPPAAHPATIAADHVSNTGAGEGARAGEGSGHGLSGEGPGKGQASGAGAGGNGDGRDEGGLYVGEFGQGDGPKFRHRSPLRYPDAAKRAGQQGKVRLRLDIDAEGVLRHVSVVEHTGLEFVEEALRAIKASTFYPAKRQGRSEACNALLTIRFALS